MKCCELTAGKLRHKIDFQREADVPDGMGGSNLVWDDLFVQVPAFVKPASGNETLHSMRLEARISHKIFLRHMSGIKPSDRILFDGRPMQIRSIINLEERNRWMEISVDEGVAQ